MAEAFGRLRGPSEPRPYSICPGLNVFMTGKFESIYQRHVNSVYRFAISCVGRREIAEEITSDAFLALLRNIESIDEAQLPGWLISVARNRARDYWRRAATERRYLGTLEDLPRAGTNAGSFGLLDNPDLKPVHRVCLTLRFVEGMTRAEIAREVGLSETQIKGHLQYSMKLLRKAVVGGGGK